MWKCLFAEVTNSGLKVHVLHLMRINEYAEGSELCEKRDSDMSESS